MESAWLIFIILIVCKADYAPDGFRDQSPPTPQSQFKEFPKILWTYWSSGLDNTKIWTKLCLNNLRHFSQMSGYELQFLTDQNYTNYLSAQNSLRMQGYVNLLQKNRLGVQAKSDLLRAFLMYEHGGMYLDANSYFTRDFGWASQLYEWPWVYNRIASDPEVLLFTRRQETSFKCNQTKIFDQKLGHNITLFPAFQNWFMMARPNSKFFTDFLDVMGTSLQKGYDWMNKDGLTRGIDYCHEFSNYFLLGNFALSIVVHNKQVELDATINPPTKYAVDYYKLWTIHSQSSGYFFWLNILAGEIYTMPPQFSSQELDDIFEYQTRLLFVKSTSGTTKTFEERLQQIYNKTCVQVSHQTRPQSLFYQSLINISSMFPEVDSLKKTLEYNEGKCNALSQETDNIRYIFNFFKYAMFAAIIGIMLTGPATYILRFVIGKKQKNY